MSEQIATVRRGRLSPHEREQIEVLALRKLTAGQIALRLNRISATINFAMHYMGLKVPTDRQFSYTRKNGSEVHSFDDAEDVMILEMRAAQAVCREIAAECMARFGRKRSTQTIRTRLKMLANLGP